MCVCRERERDGVGVWGGGGGDSVGGREGVGVGWVSGRVWVSVGAAVVRESEGVWSCD